MYFVFEAINFKYTIDFVFTFILFYNKTFSTFLFGEPELDLVSASGEPNLGTRYFLLHTRTKVRKTKDVFTHMIMDYIWSPSLALGFAKIENS